MVGVIDVGGGTRDVYGAGVFDYCLDNDIHFDYCIGVSAGSANCASFLADQRGRNYRFYAKYSFRKEYMSLHNFIQSGSYINLEYIYATLSNSNGEDPLDYKKIKNSPAQFNVVVTDALTGNAVCMNKTDDMAQDNYRALMASCCTPIACKPIKINGRPYYDGGISEPIPFQRALNDGCDKIVVILTKPINTVTKPFPHWLKALFPGEYSQSAYALFEREEKYKNSVAHLQKLESEGKALIIAPKSIGKMKTLTKDLNQINELYSCGYKDAEAIVEFVYNN